ncbi:unnamed protein product [Zymoseptoria tritici ST99CH_3D7]|uniref:Uncharacterized protein n=1 Tax=Zymoseptoria tritici (strain ST99CH_3D7) TaxID=1276538 RepID=A0A1X7RU97_ZYMT9|nr:unnamed protein product [Zymoseptoria tritici ST99CH_3D7]
MSELQVPTLRRSQRISLSQASSRSATPTPTPTITKRAAPKETKRAVSRVTKPSGKTSKSKQKSSAATTTSTSKAQVSPPTPTSREPSPTPTSHPTPAPTPRVDRLYHPNTWSSTPASLPFLTHGALPTTPSTTTLTLNILDYTIQPSHWNPLLSANKLSAACFFFASLLSGNPVSATQVAGSSGWCHADYAAALARGGGGAVGEVLRVLDVSREEVVRGYGVLMGMREGLRGVVGEFEGRLEGLPGVEEVAGWEGREREEGRVHAREVRERMRGLGFVSGKRVEEVVEEVLEEGGGQSGVEDEKEEETGKPSVPLIEVELEDFEDFVAENE